MSKWLKKHKITGEVKAQLNRLHHNILEPVRITFGLDFIRRGFIFQDKNVHAHAARIVIVEFHENSLDYMHMEWPPYSPDLNPIEQAWICWAELSHKSTPNHLPKKNCFLIFKFSGVLI